MRSARVAVVLLGLSILAMPLRVAAQGGEVTVNEGIISDLREGCAEETREIETTVPMPAGFISLRW